MPCFYYNIFKFSVSSILTSQFTSSSVLACKIVSLHLNASILPFATEKKKNSDLPSKNKTKKKKIPRIYILACLRQSKLGFWSLVHESLFSLEKGLPQLWVFPALCCIFQCYFWLIFSEYYFCYLLFSVSVVLKAVLTPIIILSKE